MSEVIKQWSHLSHCNCQVFRTYHRASLQDSLHLVMGLCAATYQSCAPTLSLFSPLPCCCCFIKQLCCHVCLCLCLFVQQTWDLRSVLPSPPLWYFAHMPLMHSESLKDQDVSQ